eukprot:13445526-Alexandrium_andersonii.AAC.1
MLQRHRCLPACRGLLLALMQEAGSQLRARVAKELEEGGAFYAVYFTPITEDERHMEGAPPGHELPRTWQHYLSAVCRPKRWIDPLCFWAAANVLRRDIVCGELDQTGVWVPMGLFRPREEEVRKEADARPPICVAWCQHHL